MPSATRSTAAGAPPAAEPAVFACPKCAATYRWKPELSGKKIRCKKCQTTFAPAVGDAADAAVAAVGAKGGYAMLAHRVSRKVATDEDELNVVHNWVLPLIVLGIGVALRMWQVTAHASRYESVALWESLGTVALEWLLVSVAVGGGLLIGAMFMEIDLEKLGRAALKVTSIAILMCAVAQVCSSFDRSPNDLNGMMLGVPCVLLLAFFMLAAMFGADLVEALMGTVAITVFVVGALVAMAFLMQGETGVVLGFGRPVVG